MNTGYPPQKEPIAGLRGIVSKIWHDWFYRVANKLGLAVTISDIASDGTLLRKTSDTGSREYEATRISIDQNSDIIYTDNNDTSQDIIYTKIENSIDVNSTGYEVSSFKFWVRGYDSSSRLFDILQVGGENSPFGGIFFEYPSKLQIVSGYTDSFHPTIFLKSTSQHANDNSGFSFLLDSDNGGYSGIFEVIDNTDGVYTDLIKIDKTSLISNVIIDINGKDLIIDADGDSKISASTDDIVIHTTNNTERFRVTDSGVVMNSAFDLNGNDLIIGADGGHYFHETADDTARFVYHDGSYQEISPTGMACVSGNTLSSILTLLTYSADSAVGPYIALSKSHSNTIGTAAQTLDDELHGLIIAYGRTTAGGANTSGSIWIEQDGSSTATRVPGAIVFKNNNGTTANIERMRIAADGTISLPIDNQNLKLGGGLDMGIYYDGTNANIDTDLVAASDLNIDCGTEKTLVLETVVWDDLRVVPGNFDRPGVSDPSLIAYNVNGGGIDTYLWEFAKNNVACFTVQLPHSYKQGENISVHLHWTPGPRGNEENGATVGWKIDYSWANINGNFGTMATADLSDACDGTDHKHQMTPEATITGTGKNISSMLLCNVKRTDTGTDDTWAGTTNGNLPMLLEIDFHYPIDTMGSRQIGTK